MCLVSPPHRRVSHLLYTANFTAGVARFRPLVSPHFLAIFALTHLEIQPTAAPLVTGKMFNGLCLCYAIMISTFFSVAISQSVILSNFVQQDGSTLVPR
ncbi:hypothetical protein ZIOFF_012143 [Zingiber officinale]|uniref:Uncharacterized protein n=1 Tax=Zingiber officinale TaxID=94328 RepID=A0A8J5I6Y1_ZINOF|nr:hypothetical protein ZIOFF_012143 [Zingiber officinale]